MLGWLFYLLSYSPELNPDEMLNADLKQAVTKLAPARTKLQLVRATSSHLRSAQRRPERIRKSNMSQFAMRLDSNSMVPAQYWWTAHMGHAHARGDLRP